MGLSGAFFGCSGDVGFSGPLLGVSSGVVGFSLAMLSRLVRDVFLPAWPGVCVSVKKFALRGANDVETRKSSPSAGKMTPNWRLMARWASFFTEMPLEGRCWASFFADRQSWDPTGQVVSRLWCSGCWRARPLCVPVGGGPPASRPRRELRLARRLEARPGPAAAHRHRGRSLRRPPHRRRLACWRVDWCVVSKHSQARHRPRAPQPGPPDAPAPSIPVALGVQVRSVGRPRPRC